jgi:hypothetical protein
MVELIFAALLWQAPWTEGSADVAQLGSPSFRAREAAQARVAAHLDQFVAAVALGEWSADAEIRARCRILMDSWYRRHAVELAERMKPWRWRDWPRLDTLKELDGSGDAVSGALDHYWAKALATMLQKDRDNPSIFAEATRLLIVDRIAARLPCRSLIRDLCAAESQFRRDNGMPPPPKLHKCGRGK